MTSTSTKTSSFVCAVRWSMVSSFVLAAACSPAASAAGAPGNDASVASVGDADGGPPDAEIVMPAPAYCVPPVAGLVDVATTPAGPYFVRHPAAATARDVPTILFIPGGPGSKDTARATFDLWLSRGKSLGDYRVVLPYAADGDLTDESERAIAVLDEVLACYGGIRSKVHLAGTSNGGRAAFALMLRHSDRFATLLGAPGVFGSVADAALVAAFTGKAVFNGAGGLDDTWRPLAQKTNSRLKTLGLDSVYVEFPGQGHILDEQADQEVFFSFWSSHR